MSNAAILKIEDQIISSGATTVTVPIKVSSFNVGFFYFWISWDPAVLTYNSFGDITSGNMENFSFEAPPELWLFGESSFNTDFVGGGNLAVGYEQPWSESVTIAHDETLFSVTFDVIGGGGSSTAVSFTGEPLTISGDSGTIEIFDDKTSPIINLIGAATLHHEAGYAFTDPGATATDNFDTTITVITSGTVDHTTPGTYILTYTASDEADNAATAVTRTVVVADTIAPVITLAGLTTMNHEAGMAYTDAGAMAADNVDATVTVITSGIVDVNAPGTYTLTYAASDEVGNISAVVKRTVMVADTTPPLITLLGDAAMTIGIGSSFTDPGASVNDSFEGQLSAEVTGAVDEDALGSYTLT
ncbi:DUF5011 domain-containing protein, partial [bacterium]|nr:DUF5011 domain-containing protein [bacterium]